MATPEGALFESPGSGAERRTTVLFAGVCIAEKLGTTTDEPREAKAVARCLEALGQAAEISGGRVAHRRHNEVMALFATPDAAAVAATRMHAYAEALVGAYSPASEKLGVRIGFHSGPVAQRNNDIFGETVDLALQLIDVAKSGQIVTSAHTASSLSPGIQDCVRPLRRIRVKGKEGDLLVGQLEWRNAVDAIASALKNSSRTMHATLHLNYRDKRLLRRREGDSVTMGRDPECDLCIDDQTASRQHCTIERRDGKFVLRDHSTNGTFVMVDGKGEVHVHAEELALIERGRVALGQSGDATKEIVKYICA